MNKSEIWKNYRFPIILLSGIMIGAVIGVIFGEKAKVLAPCSGTDNHCPEY